MQVHTHHSDTASLRPPLARSLDCDCRDDIVRRLLSSMATIQPVSKSGYIGSPRSELQLLGLGPNSFREKVSTFRAKAPVPSPEF